ncbi:hypothetical protein ACO1O0_006856 [Amphichorda felina]
MGAPRRSPAKPSPRPLPPPGPDGEDDYNPFIGRTLRRSPETGVRVPPPPEPQLPPSVDDPISSTPPRGIHSSSPSRNKGKNKTKTTKTGSPLKQPPARPGDNENEIVNPLPRKLFGDKGAPPSSLRNGTVLAETTNNVRKIAAFDANTEKRKERDALRDQLAKLKRDLEVTARQNDRIRAMQKSGRTVPLADESEIMEIIRRQLLPQHWDSQPTQTQMLAKAALDPMAIVPFGKPAASAVPTDADEEEIADIKSHNPIPMTAEEELPFLQLFAPFSASSSLTVLPRIGEEPLLQLFTIQLRSRNSPGLFGAKLEVTVESTKLSIVSLKIAALEPAAKPELGAFLERICTGDCNRSMQRNVGIVSWAMAEWLRVAEQRARFWSQLHRDTASKELLLETSKHARTRKGKRAKDGQEKETQEAKEGPIKSQELLRFMGEQSFDLRVPSIHGSTPPSSLRLSWKIEFDWSGEAQSKVAVMVGVPGKCEYNYEPCFSSTFIADINEGHQTDRKGALGKLPSLFQNLVEAGEEPKVAVRKVVALLVGEE